MASSSAVLKKFLLMPAPFPNSPSDIGVTLTPRDDYPQKNQQNIERTSREDSAVNSLNISSISFEDTLLGDDDSSRDSGFGSEAVSKTEVPRSFEDLFNKPVLTSPPSPVTTEDDNGASPFTRGNATKTRNARKGLFQTQNQQSPLVSTLKDRRTNSKRLSRSEQVNATPVIYKRHKTEPQSDKDQRSSSKNLPRSFADALISSSLDSDTLDMIGDFTRPHSLPTIVGRHKDLGTISPQTMSDILDHKYSCVVDKVTVVDCRYPYEFVGGHIQDAVNIWERDTMYERFLSRTNMAENSSKRQIITFHCEFSSERGPKMMRFLRAMDREANKENYPSLYYPEIYLLEGGYKAFFQHHQDQCQPRSYLPMAQREYLEDLKHFRTKSRTWAGEKTAKGCRAGHRLLKL